MPSHAEKKLLEFNPKNRNPRGREGRGEERVPAFIAALSSVLSYKTGWALAAKISSI
jgi:hypothetical protein